jgi:ferredoxin-type protein NapH
MTAKRSQRNRLKELRAPLTLLIAFWVLAVLLWQGKGNIFYLLNFGYIGSALAVGLGLYILLPRQRKPTGRRIAQLLVGIYMLGFLGFLEKENMQLEGFFFYLLGSPPPHHVAGYQ